MTFVLLNVTLHKKIDFKMLMLTYKYLNYLSPPYMPELLEIYQPSHPLLYGTRSVLTVPTTCLKTYGDRAIACRAPSLWHDLPSETKNALSLDNFKIKLMSYLFKK